MSMFSRATTFHLPEIYDHGGPMTPTTPRPNTAPSSNQQMPRMEDATTPTRANFGSMASQRPLPSTTSVSLPVIATVESDQSTVPRREPMAPANSKRSHDVDMDDSDDGGDDASEDGSLNPDGSKAPKKKKGQKFYCTDYPPCNLSFTRSEHLARHIRKHTGERPFQCHCARRFSRLDNLRQHAQTVHVNEDIPIDSLAASGTRFQRQVRTERARPIGNRSRASTVGSQSSGGRGHHRNSLSASSIGSVTSTYSQRDDPRRRPPPLPLASDPRARLSLETYNFRPASPSSQYYRPASPGAFGTPPSTNSAGGQNSPRWTGVQSPPSNHSRTQSLYQDHRTPGRRLSVPSGQNPFQTYAPSYGPPQLSPLNSSNSAVFPILPSNTPNAMPSPTSSNSGSSWSRRESVASMVEGDWRRRTWHSDTHTNFTSSRLNLVTTPNQYQTQQQLYQYPPPPPPPPAFTLASQNTPPQKTRLPGIESFDPLRPHTPTRRDDSPMAMDTPSRHTNQAMDTYRQDEHQQPQLDRSLNQNLNGLEVVPGARPPPNDSAHLWASEAERAVQEQAEQVRSSQPTVRFEQPIAYHQPQTQYAVVHPHHVSAPPVTPRSAKRAGWYNGPIKSNDRSQGNSTTDSGSPGGVPGTPQPSNVSDYNGAVQQVTWVEPVQQMQDPRTMQFQFPSQVSSSSFQGFAPPAGENYTYVQNGGDHSLADMNGNRGSHARTSSDMDRLQTLVAVATGENTVASAY